MEILKSGGRVSRTGCLILILVSAVALSLICTGAASAQTLTTLSSFNGSNGANPFAGLIADANGNLFGETSKGGEYGYGAVFEIVNNSGVYAGTPTILVSFNGSNGARPYGRLIADANGNLFGTTLEGGEYNAGTVFEIVNNSGVYSGTPITLVSFSGSNGQYPEASLIADAHGNLFGATSFGGVGGAGTVFEIVNNSGVYASTPTTLVSFNYSNGAHPYASLIDDANGNLFGTTFTGGEGGYGTVFEIVNNSGVYASTPTTLASFNGSNGAYPYASLIADANGNLFGTTTQGGVDALGTVFEIVNNSGVYADTPTTLASFSGSGGDGAKPYAGLIADANGNLFGTTYQGGVDGLGTVFELTGSGFASPKQFDGIPGAANCVGQSISSMAKTYGGDAHAAAALGYTSVKDLQSAVSAYCGNN